MPAPFAFPHALPVAMRQWVVLDPETGCWLWTRAKNAGGYGVLGFNGRTRLAHRVAYERVKGPLRARFVLDHLCHVPACVNPEHLDQVTNTENLRRGRTVKLGPDRVEAIRLMRVTLGWSYAKIARVFFVTPQCVHYACSGRNWAELGSATPAA